MLLQALITFMALLNCANSSTLDVKSLPMHSKSFILIHKDFRESANTNTKSLRINQPTAPERAHNAPLCSKLDSEYLVRWISRESKIQMNFLQLIVYTLLPYIMCHKLKKIQLLPNGGYDLGVFLIFHSQYILIYNNVFFW